MRILASAIAFLALTVAALAMPPVPRKSPEFTVTDPSGKQILLSSFKGKVVVMPLMFTTCPHCQAEAKMLTKLQMEFAGRGLQVLGAAFNEEANGPVVAQFIKEFNVGFPVGYAKRDSVISYLGLSVMDRWVVPQVAVIDRKGMIVAQSDALGTVDLQTESYMRTLIDKLLKEGATTSSTAPAKKTVAKSE
jgi:peroxiredoxin